MVGIGLGEDADVAEADVLQAGRFGVRVCLDHLGGMRCPVIFHLIFGEEGEDGEGDARVYVGQESGDFRQLICFHDAGYVQGKYLEDEVSPDHLPGQGQDTFVIDPCEPAVHVVVECLDIEPEGIDTALGQQVKRPGCQPIAVGLEQYPQVGLSFDQLRALTVELGSAADVAAGEGSDIPRRAESLGTQDDLLWFQNAGAPFRSLCAIETRAAAPAGIVRVPCGSAFSRLGEGNILLILKTFLQDVLRRIPLPIHLLAEVPGVAFLAGHVTAGLVYGEVVLGP